jgi:hypothetical protein
MDLGEEGWGDVDWIGVAQDRNRWRALVNSVLNLRVPYNAGKLSSGPKTNGLSNSAQLHRVSLLVSVLHFPPASAGRADLPKKHSTCFSPVACM